MRVLFVCSGNICRSPTAEAVMRHLARERGVEVEVDSAGIGAWHAGSPPDPRSSEAARRRGIELDGTARQVSPADFDRFDLLVAMDASHLRDLRAIAPGAEARARARMLIDGADVPDPYYDGADGFERVLDLVAAGCERLLDELADADPA
jgi:protein-tyrosine phosphatase